METRQKLTDITMYKMGGYFWSPPFCIDTEREQVWNMRTNNAKAMATMKLFCHKLNNSN